MANSVKQKRTEVVFQSLGIKGPCTHQPYLRTCRPSWNNQDSLMKDERPAEKVGLAQLRPVKTSQHPTHHPGDLRCRSKPHQDYQSLIHLNRADPSTYRLASNNSYYLKPELLGPEEIGVQPVRTCFTNLIKAKVQKKVHSHKV